MAELAAADGTVLWGDSPDYTGVVQVVDYDCWFAAASIAVTYVSPTWTENMFYFPPDATAPNANASMANLTSPSSYTAVYSIFDHNTLQPSNFTATVANESTTEDTPGGYWWHSAVMQALYFLAWANPSDDGADGSTIDGVFTNWTFVPYKGDAYNGLTILTGIEATSTYTADLTPDELFAILTRAPSTPVTISTPSTVNTSAWPPIEPDHAYAVLYTETFDDGSRNVTVRNPWGATDPFTFEYVWQNTYSVQHLANFESLVWNGQNWAT
ncbi:hypothetical protein Q5752_000885 [Cryptotrichosporon argae]